MNVVEVVVEAYGIYLKMYCPGCEKNHTISTPTWDWDGSLEKPTISPSILVHRVEWDPPVTAENVEDWKRSPWDQTPVERVCHSYVRNGVWEYLADCTHKYAGQHVDMVPIP